MTNQSTELQRIGPDFAPVLVTKHFTLTPHGLIVRGEPDYSECTEGWKQLRSMEKGIQFGIGDMAKYLRERWGEKADQIITAATGWSHETVRAYEWAAEKVPMEVRHMEELTYSHHQAVAKLPPREQSKWLDKAAAGDGAEPWTVSKLKANLKSEGSGAEPSYWFMVRCKSDADRTKLQKRLESEGYTTQERGA